MQANNLSDVQTTSRSMLMKVVISLGCEAPAQRTWSGSGGRCLLWLKGRYIETHCASRRSSSSDGVVSIAVH
jgi:hypothetical protein